MSKRIIQPNKERVLVVGGPANGQSHNVDPGSDILKIESPTTGAGVILGKPVEFVYKIRKLRVPDPVTNKQEMFRVACHEETSVADVINALFVMYHQGQMASRTAMPEELKQKLWPTN